jgi:hypothetical protein
MATLHGVYVLESGLIIQRREEKRRDGEPYGEISGSHGCEYEGECILGCCAV